MLAHVMVHEITHVIEGVCRHSKRGIMKAVWTDEDTRWMRARPLKFAEEDVKLIQVGLRVRATVARSAPIAVAGE